MLPPTLCLIMPIHFLGPILCFHPITWVRCPIAAWCFSIIVSNLQSCYLLLIYWCFSLDNKGARIMFCLHYIPRTWQSGIQWRFFWQETPPPPKHRALERKQIQGNKAGQETWLTPERLPLCPGFDQQWHHLNVYQSAISIIMLCKEANNNHLPLCSCIHCSVAGPQTQVSSTCLILAPWLNGYWLPGAFSSW